jgi:hypothetical protein
VAAAPRAAAAAEAVVAVGKLRVALFYCAQSRKERAQQ